MNNKINHGIVIAEIIEKSVRKDKNKDTYWILNLSICKRLTEMYLELRNETTETLPSNDKPLYVFPNINKNRFAYSLNEGNIYLFWYKKHPSNENGYYLHVEDWRKLANDRKTVERSYRVLYQKDETEEIEELTNQELINEIKKRLKENKITFKISATDQKTEEILIPILNEIDAELKDTESRAWVNLLEGNQNEAPNQK